MSSLLGRLGRRIGKPVVEATLPWAERLMGFRTARGDYLPDRLRILTRRYEAEELELMRPLLRPGQTILDVGANVGYTTRFFAQIAGPTGKVHAFEPNPLIFPLLKQNIASLEQVSVYNVALSSANGEFPLFLAGSNQGVASFCEKYPAFHLAYREGEVMRSVRAQAVVGDELLRKKGIDHVDVIKIDVEGWELNVLSGLAETISRSAHLTVFCEFNPRAQECAGRAPAVLIDWLMNRHFLVSYPCNGQLRPLSKDMVESFIAEPGAKGFTTLFAWQVSNNEKGGNVRALTS
jgi:FkbM family methyltransferase